MNDIEKRIEEIILRGSRLVDDKEMVKRNGDRDDCLWCGHPIRVSKRIEEVITDLTNLYHQLLLEETERHLEALKLWRPYFYRDKVTDEDIKELPAILTTLNKEKD